MTVPLDNSFQALDPDAASEPVNSAVAGYEYRELPDLSAQRFPPGTYHTLSAPFSDLLSDFCRDPADHYFRATIIYIVGRILGAYCASTDILIGVQNTDRDRTSLPRPVRIQWSSTTTCIQVIRSVVQHLERVDKVRRITPDALRRSLGLTKQQTPFVARVFLSSHELEGELSGFPERIAFNITPSCLHVCASDKYVHPSVLKQVLSQIVALAAHALVNPALKATYFPELSPHLKSVYEKLPHEQRCLVYSHVPPVRLATDHLALRAASQPDDVAVKWYPDLTKSFVISGPETITYKALHIRCNQTARWLIRQGLRKGQKVAVCMNRDVLFHVALIAILRAGGCYVPVSTMTFIEGSLLTYIRVYSCCFRLIRNCLRSGRLS